MFKLGNLDPSCPTWLADVLRRIERAQNDAIRTYRMDVLHSEPEKLYEGLVATADGTDWNPGTGGGTYQYRGGAWQAWEGGGGGGITTEDAMDAVAGMLTAGNGITLSYNDPANTLTVTSTTYSTRVTVDFGASWSDKAQTVVTGQTWVTANSEFSAQVLTPSGVDPDEMYLLDMRVEISSIVAGTGFTVTVYSQPEAKDTYTVMVTGTV